MGGRNHRLTIGPYVEGKAREEFDLGAARKKAEDARALIKQGIDPAAAKQIKLKADKAERVRRRTAPASEAAPGSFKAIADEYLETHVKRNNAPGTYAETRRLIAFDAIPAWGERPLASLTADDVLELARKIDRRGAHVQANRTPRRLQALWNWAIEQRLIKGPDGKPPPSPFAGLKPLTVETERDRVLSDAEIVWFWQACDELAWPFGPLFKLLLLTAQRRDEVGTMEWSDLDLDRNLWIIPREKAKNNRVHEVQLSDAAVDLLRALPRIGRHVFTTDGERDRPVSGFSRAKRRLDAAMIAAQARGLAPGRLPVEIPEFILHDLRRTAATGMAKMKIPPQVVDKILNHRTGTIRGVAAIYNRYEYGEERAAALAAWSRHVVALVSPAETNVVLRFQGR